MGVELPDSLVSNEVTEAAEVTTVTVGLSSVGAGLSAVRAELPDSPVSNEVTEAVEVTTVGVGLSSVRAELPGSPVSNVVTGWSYLVLLYVM